MVFESYLEKITRFVVWLLEQEHSVRLIIGDRGDTPAVQHVTREVLRQKGPLAEHIFSATPIESLDDVFRALAGTDIVIATRYHNVVCALMLGKPVISLGYGAKNDVLLADVGMGRYCQHIEGFEPSVLMDHFCEVQANQKRFEACIRQRTEGYRRLVSDQFSTLLGEPATRA